MGVDKEPAAVREPGSRDNFPIHLVILKSLWIGNGMNLAGLKEFDVYPFKIGVREVFPIGRDRPRFHQNLRGIGGELPQFKIRPSLRERRLASGEPKNCTNKKQ